MFTTTSRGVLKPSPILRTYRGTFLLPAKIRVLLLRLIVGCFRNALSTCSAMMASQVLQQRTKFNGWKKKQPYWTRRSEVYSRRTERKIMFNQKTTKIQWMSSKGCSSDLWMRWIKAKRFYIHKEEQLSTVAMLYQEASKTLLGGPKMVSTARSSSSRTPYLGRNFTSNFWTIIQIWYSKTVTKTSLKHYKVLGYEKKWFRVKGENGR